MSGGRRGVSLIVQRDGAPHPVEFRVQRAQLFCERAAVGGGKRRGPPCAESFELPDDVEQLVDVRPRERCDGESRLLRARRPHDEPFLL